MLSISIQTIPHKKQRYPTCGDWFWNGDFLTIYISQMSDWRYEFLISFHELFEAFYCKYKGIKQEEVDAFDVKFEKERDNGLHDAFQEPGDDSNSPYHHGHFMASHLEAIAAFCLGVDWNAYALEVEKL